MRRYFVIILVLALALSLPVLASAAPESGIPARGDINGTGGITLEDVQALYEYLTHGTIPASAGYTAADILNVADYNNDGAVNILDYQALYVYVTTKNNGGSSEWSPYV